jgi:hypothetical protein
MTVIMVMVVVVAIVVAIAVAVDRIPMRIPPQKRRMVAVIGGRQGFLWADFR